MVRIRFRNLVVALLGVCSMTALAQGAEPTASLKKGTPDLKSAGPLAFGPDGILLVGDTKGAALRLMRKRLTLAPVNKVHQ